MSRTAENTTGITDYKINGTLYMDGQIIGQDCSLTLSVFMVENKHHAVRKCEQVFVGQSLIDSEK